MSLNHAESAGVVSIRSGEVQFVNVARQLDFYRRYGKRMMDVVAASFLLVALSPLFLTLFVLTSLDRGPAFFAHTRVGKGGRSFRCYKFRTMMVGAEAMLQQILRNDPARAQEWRESFKLTEDPRVTRIGAFLRKTSLDELPQLWNVLKGDMSLVGPRPVTAEELSRYGDRVAEYLSMRPGLTGPWQVLGRNDLTYDERVALDSDYVRWLTAIGDVRILLLTFVSVLGGTGR